MEVDYREAVKQALRPFGDYKSLDPRSETVVLFDDHSAHYAVILLGWENGERIYEPLVHVRIHDGRVVVEINTTDDDIDRLLLEAGIPYSALVLNQEEPAPPA